MAGCRYLKIGSTELCGKAIIGGQDALPEKLRGYCSNHKLRIVRGGGTIPCEKCGRGCRTILHNICYRCGGRVVSNKILENRRGENVIGCRYLKCGSTDLCGKAIVLNQDALPENLKGYCGLHKYRIIHNSKIFPCNVCGIGCRKGVCKKCIPKSRGRPRKAVVIQ